MHTSLVVILGLLLLAATAEAQIVVDQSQLVVDPLVGPMAIGGPSFQQLAQTVTVGVDGSLLGVLLPISCDSGLLVIEIRTLDGDKPSNVVLRRRRIDASMVPGTGPLFRPFLVSPLPFEAGARFAIVLRNPTGSCGIQQGPVGNPYPGGEGFFQALPNPPGWIPFSETETRLDLPFITVMQVP